MAALFFGSPAFPRLPLLLFLAHELHPFESIHSALALVEEWYAPDAEFITLLHHINDVFPSKLWADPDYAVMLVSVCGRFSRFCGHADQGSPVIKLSEGGYPASSLVDVRIIVGDNGIPNLELLDRDTNDAAWYINHCADWLAIDRLVFVADDNLATSLVDHDVPDAGRGVLGFVEQDVIEPQFGA